MALIKCPECGHDVSTAAFSCPNCGYPIKIRSSVKIHRLDVSLSKTPDFFYEYIGHIITLHEKALSCILNYIKTSNAHSIIIFFEIVEEASNCLLEIYIDCSDYTDLCELLGDMKKSKEKLSDICGNIVYQRHSPKELAGLTIESMKSLENVLNRLTEIIKNS